MILLSPSSESSLAQSISSLCSEGVGVAALTCVGVVLRRPENKRRLGNNDDPVIGPVGVAGASSAGGAAADALFGRSRANEGNNVNAFSIEPRDLDRSAEE